MLRSLVGSEMCIRDSYVHPSTASSVSNLVKSLLEISLWKVGWLLISSLVWGNAFSQINDSEVFTLSIVVMNFMLIFSMIALPFFIHTLFQGGVAATGRAAAVMVATSSTVPAAAVYGAPKKAIKTLASKATSKRPIIRKDSNEKSN